MHGRIYLKPTFAEVPPVNGVPAILAVLLLTAQTYRVGPERVIWVGKFAELGAGTFVLDFASRRFTRATEAETSALRDLEEIETHTEPVAFRSGDVPLAGKLTLPSKDDRHPAIVLIHGSNDADRDHLDPWVGFFVSHGVAVLSYDKRGVRESGGDWKEADFQDLAGDVLAGVRLLRNHKAIDASRIGLMGFSQGGWIAPVAASRDRGIAFIILHAGSGLRVAENGLLFVEAELRGYGFPDEEIRQALAYYRLNDDVTRNPERFKELHEQYQKAQARKVEWLLEPPQPNDFWFRRFYRRILDFDPAPYWAKVRCPVLAFLGELDHNVPPEPNRKALETALRRRLNADSTIVVLPHANHLFLHATTGTREEYAQLSTFVDGYFNVMEAWLRQKRITK